MYKNKHGDDSFLKYYIINIQTNRNFVLLFQCTVVSSWSSYIVCLRYNLSYFSRLQESPYITKTKLQMKCL